MEPSGGRGAVATSADGPKPPFRQALQEGVWADPEARRFAVFVAVSMLALQGAQDLILEPFAGTVFGMTPAESTPALSSTQHQGVLVGMILVALFGSAIRRGRAGTLKAWIVGGCVASAVAIGAIGLWRLRRAGLPAGRRGLRAGRRQRSLCRRRDRLDDGAGRRRRPSAAEGTRLGVFFFFFFFFFLGRRAGPRPSDSAASSAR